MCLWKKKNKRRCTVAVSPAFLALLLVFAAADRQRLLVHILLAAAVHEAGHAAAVHLAGGEIALFRITLFGAEMRIRRSERLSYGREILSVLAGPGVNLLCALVLGRVAGALDWEAGYAASGIHAALALFNLLPVRPLDGGRILHLALSRFGERRARLICRAVTMFVAAGVLAYFVRSCFSRPAWTALVFSVLLAAGAFGGARYSRLTFSRGKSFSRGVEERRVVIDAARTVQDALRYLTEERYLVLVLYAEGEYLGELTEEEYLAALSAGKYAEPLSECLPKL